MMVTSGKMSVVRDMIKGVQKKSRMPYVLLESWYLNFVDGHMYLCPHDGRVWTQIGNFVVEEHGIDFGEGFEAIEDYFLTRLKGKETSLKKFFSQLLSDLAARTDVFLSEKSLYDDCLRFLPQLLDLLKVYSEACRKRYANRQRVFVDWLKEKGGYIKEDVSAIAYDAGWCPTLSRYTYRSDIRMHFVRLDQVPDVFLLAWFDKHEKKAEFFLFERKGNVWHYLGTEKYGLLIGSGGWRGSLLKALVEAPVVIGEDFKELSKKDDRR
jgi:hypothetical protein